MGSMDYDRREAAIQSRGLKPGLYRHFKGGKYKVLHTARYSEDESLMVVYLNAKGEPWVRPLKMWNEVTDRWPDGVRRPRFVPVEKAPDIFDD